MNKRFMAIVAGGVLALLLIGGGVYFAVNGSRSGAQTERQNKLSLAADYLKNGEYQRALDLVDQLLIKNANDAAAKKLRDETVAAQKAAAQAEQKRQLFTARAAESAAAQLALFTRVRSQVAESTGLGSGRSEGGCSCSRKEAEARAQEAEAQRKLAELQIQKQLAAQKQAELDRQKQLEQQKKDEQAKKLAEMNAQQRARQAKLDKLIADGTKALDSGDYSTARSDFNDALGVESDYAPALSGLARSYYLQDPTNSENLQKAVGLANRAIAKDPSLWEPHYTLGQVYQQTELFDEAIKELKAAVRLKPDNASVLFALGNAQYRAGQFHEARGSYENCVRHKPVYRQCILQPWNHGSDAEGHIRSVESFSLRGTDQAERCPCALPNRINLPRQ